MIDNKLKLLFSAFMVILLGVVLIQPIADDVETTATSTVDILNESVSLTVVTSIVINETITMDVTNTSGNLSNNYITVLSALVNSTEIDNLLGYCNLTHSTGLLTCNDTASNVIYANYTFNVSSTGQLSSSYDEWTSFDACRNSTMTAIATGVHCNMSLTTGAITTIYDNFTDDVAFIDYKYEPDTYVSSGSARTLLTITILFFALAVLAVGIGFAVKSFKDGGVM